MYVCINAFRAPSDVLVSQLILGKLDIVAVKALYVDGGTRYKSLSFVKGIDTNALLPLTLWRFDRCWKLTSEAAFS